jgi:transcriptional regulator with XRE-family HTH domain
MSRTLAEQLQHRPVDGERVSAIEAELRRKIRATRLKELRASLAVTQTALAEQLSVSQNRVSQIERGNIERTQVETLRRYIEALGGELIVEARFGSEFYVLDDPKGAA